MRCLYSDNGECIARIPEACKCAQMPRFMYINALQRRIERELSMQGTGRQEKPE